MSLRLTIYDPFCEIVLHSQCRNEGMAVDPVFQQIFNEVVSQSILQKFLFIRGHICRLAVSMHTAGNGKKP